MAKGTSRGEATSNSEKIKSVALAIVQLCESEGIRQLVADFRWIYFVVRPHDLLRPYYEPLLWFMIHCMVLGACNFVTNFFIYLLI